MKKTKLTQVSWQIVAMFAIAFVSVTVAYILSTMTPEQYYNVLQLIVSFFAGYVLGNFAPKTGDSQCQ